MRGLHGAPGREAADIRHKFRELSLIELVAAPVQSPHSDLREGTPVALQMLEGDLGVVPAVVQIDRGYVTKALPKIGRERKLREVRPPEWRGDQTEAR
jgi:hypothetical protein